MRKGAPAQNFYILLSGTAEVLDDSGICLSRLSKSDVFGEMSLISGDPVGATIKVVEAASILAIQGPDFKEIINKKREPLYCGSFLFGGEKKVTFKILNIAKSTYLLYETTLSRIGLCGC